MVATAWTHSVVAAAPRHCPGGVMVQLNGLYQWQLARQNSGSRGDLALVRQRFTPSLFALLQRAWDLDPQVDGAYLDFDVFSGTQMNTYGAGVQRCQVLGVNLVNARVAVALGRGGRRDPSPSLLDYRMVRNGSGWRISEITYLSNGQSHTLTSSLSNLLRAASRSPR